MSTSNLVVDGRDGRTLRWDEMAPRRLEGPTAAVVASSHDGLPFALAHARSRTELLVVASARADATMREQLSADGFNVVEGAGTLAPSVVRPADAGRLWLLTSGSTGRAKRIGHTLQSLTTVSADQPPRRWLCPYSPGTYAWWQVVVLGLTRPGQDLVVVDPAEAGRWPAVALEHGVTAASGTPTFWRQTMLTSAAELAAVPLQQVTLGGEPVDQAVLDELRALLPQARISWIYASAEVGASITVHDGRAGFPVAWLDRSEPHRPVLSVRDDELLVSSPHHGHGLDGAVATGDRVTIRDGRVHIVGRVDADEINVGGAKLSAGVVRGVLQGHPSVAWSRVSARRAPLVGSVVAADVVLATGAEPEDIERRLSQWCRRDLPEYAVPRSFRFLDAIPAKETLKSDV